jgi:hypothetical protein
MRNHAIFREFDLEEDSCFVAARIANEKYLRHRQSTKEREEQVPYVATDDDLPEIFWSAKPGAQKSARSRSRLRSGRESLQFSLHSRQVD